jgi:hypothetical protein
MPTNYKTPVIQNVNHRVIKARLFLQKNYPGFYSKYNRLEDSGDHYYLDRIIKNKECFFPEFKTEEEENKFFAYLNNWVNYTEPKERKPRRTKRSNGDSSDYRKDGQYMNNIAVFRSSSRKLPNGH